jgi:hypothetical protein
MLWDRVADSRRVLDAQVAWLPVEVFAVLEFRWMAAVERVVLAEMAGFDVGLAWLLGRRAVNDDGRCPFEGRVGLEFD